MKTYKKPVVRVMRLKFEMLFGPVQSEIGDGEFSKRTDHRIIEDDEE